MHRLEDTPVRGFRVSSHGSFALRNSFFGIEDFFFALSLALSSYALNRWLRGDSCAESGDKCFDVFDLTRVRTAFNGSFITVSYKSACVGCNEAYLSTNSCPSTRLYNSPPSLSSCQDPTSSSILS